MANEIDELIDRAYQARRERRKDDADRDLQLALTMSKQANDRAREVDALRELGELHRVTPQSGASRRYYEEATRLARGLDNPSTLAHTIRHFGDVLCEANTPALAEPCYAEALAIYEKIGANEPLNHANAIRSMAVCQETRRNNDAATRHWRHALALYTATKVQPGIDECAARLSALENA